MNKKKTGWQIHKHNLNSGMSNEERKNTVEVCQVLKLKTDLLVFVNALKF